MDETTGWGDLIATLEEAEQGDRRLDAVLAYQCGATERDTRQMMRLLIDEGSSWDLILELLEGEILPFTLSLDAKMPGENIVCAMYSAKRGRWAAVHRDTDGREVLAWAANEVLARRAAGSKALWELSFAGTEEESQGQSPDADSAGLLPNFNSGAGPRSESEEEEPGPKKDWRVGL